MARLQKSVWMLPLLFIAAAVQAQDSSGVRLLGRLTGDWEIALDVKVQGDHAYLATGITGMRVVDVSNPEQMEEVGAYDSPGSAFKVRLAGDYAYLADGAAGLRILDISEPTRPQEVGVYEFDEVRSVAVAGNYAYLAAEDHGMRVVDISDPAHPAEIGFHDIPGLARDIEVSGQYVYVACREGGMRIYSVSNPRMPFELGVYNPPDYALELEVRGNIAYVAARSGGLRLVDVSDPRNPAEVGFHDTQDVLRHVDVEGNYAYVSERTEKFLVLDISTPSQPFRTGYYKTPGSPRGLDAVAGARVYLADSTNLSVLDASGAAFVRERDVGVPMSMALLPPAPNPFNSTARITFQLPVPTEAVLEVWDLRGNRTAVLAFGPRSVGKHTVVWDASGVPAGVYWLRLQAKGMAAVRKAVVVK